MRTGWSGIWVICGVGRDTHGGSGQLQGARLVDLGLGLGRGRVLSVWRGRDDAAVVDLVLGAACQPLALSMAGHAGRLREQAAALGVGEAGEPVLVRLGVVVVDVGVLDSWRVVVGVVGAFPWQAQRRRGICTVDGPRNGFDVLLAGLVVEILDAPLCKSRQPQGQFGCLQSFWALTYRARDLSRAPWRTSWQ